MRGTACAGLFLLCSCAQVAPAGDDTISFLKQGSPKACSENDVQQTIFELIRPKLGATVSQSFFELAPITPTAIEMKEALGQTTLSLKLITLSKVDKDVASVTCDATLEIGEPGGNGKEFDLTYQIRPSVQDPSSFIISANSSEPKKYASILIGGFVARARTLAERASTAEFVEQPVVEQETVEENVQADEVIVPEENESVDNYMVVQE